MSDRRSSSPNRALLDRLNALTRQVVALEQRSTWTAGIHSVQESEFGWFAPGFTPELQTPFVPANPPLPAIQYETVSLELPAGRWLISVGAQQSLEGYPGFSPPVAFTSWTIITVDGAVVEAFPLSAIAGAMDPIVVMDTTRTFTFPGTLPDGGGVVRVFVGATSDKADSLMGWFLTRFSITAFPG